MPVRLVAYPPDAAAITRWVDAGQRLRIGREPGCDLVLPHPSVSRAHAELVQADGRWRLSDLGSKNGTFIDGVASSGQPLPRSAWLRLGDVHCEFEEFDEAQARTMRDRQQERRALSMAATRRIAARHDADSLLDDVLRGVVELAGCSRGFMLLPGNGDFVVCASLLLDPAAVDPSQFQGSVGAVQRSLESGRPVVVNHVDREPWLARRRSVAGSGLQSLVCLPLLDRGRTVGAIYADRREPGEPITDFDLELLGAFAESATLWLLARRAMQSLEGAPRWGTLLRRTGAQVAP